MAIPYRARVNERVFLNLPGFRGGACVIAYVEDTSECGLRPAPYCYQCEDGDDCRHNYEPRTILEISDCESRINLEFDIDSEAARANSLHRLDTLITALRVFRGGLQAEFETYDRREAELKELRDE